MSINVEFTLSCCKKDCGESVKIGFESPAYERGQCHKVGHESTWVIPNPQEALIDHMISKYPDEWYYTKFGPMCERCYFDSDMYEE